MMPLGELVDRYIALGGEFSKPVALSAFGLSSAETERIFSAYDEDYHISRFFKFSESPDPTVAKFSVNGVASTHIALDPEIQTIL